MHPTIHFFVKKIKKKKINHWVYDKKPKMQLQRCARELQEVRILLVISW
jgi:hypothetical protein